ncbi:MAG: ornithine cyclodeaminase family protein [Bacteroidota bacterium]
MLSADHLAQLFTPAEIIAIVKQGILKEGAGKYRVPQRMHIEHEQMTYLLMPAIGERYFCSKLVSVIPANKARDLPIIQGTLILNDLATGAVLEYMDAPMITALRTAAVGAIGLERIAETSTSQLGLIGCGLQGYWQSLFAHAVRPIRRIYAYSKTRSSFENYKARMQQSHPKTSIIWCENADEVVRNAELIYTCTNARSPLFSNDAALVANKSFISIGSFRKDMQELPDVVYQQADRVLVDTITAQSEVGDLINPLRAGYITVEQLVTLADALTMPLTEWQGKQLVFKSVGMAAFDLALAVAVYEESQLK